MKERLETLKRYVVGWSNYYGIGLRYREVLALDQWLRRRVRLCYWKQWERPKTQRRELLRLGADAGEVKLASASRKGFWRMSRNSIVQRAMSNQWLAAQGVPSMKERWIAIHHDNP